MSNQRDYARSLVEEILRWENLAPTLHSDALRLMAAEHTESLRKQLHDIIGNPVPAGAWALN